MTGTGSAIERSVAWVPSQSGTEVVTGGLVPFGGDGIGDGFLAMLEPGDDWGRDGERVVAGVLYIVLSTSRPTEGGRPAMSRAGRICVPGLLSR